MRGRGERLRFLRLGNGARQVVECGDKDTAETSAAKEAERAFCNKCHAQIGRQVFHMVSGNYYHHPSCTRTF